MFDMRISVRLIARRTDPAYGFRMGEDHGGHLAASHGIQPWMVRIFDPHGTVQGAGILLDAGHVLTCAHVVISAADAAPGAEAQAAVEVDFADSPGSPPVLCRVVGDCWIPPLADDRGDIAVLALDTPQPQRSTATLRRWPLRGGLPVRAYGFPPSGSGGGWAVASLIGQGGPAGEWMQLHATAGLRIRPGFSGAAVLNDRTGHVIGMVVGAHTDATTGVSWMIPVETILGHLPSVQRWVDGPRAVDPAFADDGGLPSVDPAIAHLIAGFLTHRGGVNILVVVMGPPDSPQSAALRQAVRSSDRESGPAPDSHDPGAALVPPKGSVDLAVDATGKSVEEVLRRIAERFGIEAGDLRRVLGHDVPPITIVIARVDAAADPAGLLDELIAPLADRPENRVLLTFDRPHSDAWHAAQTIVYKCSSRHSMASVSAELDAAAVKVAALRDAERAVARLHRHVAARVTPVPALRPQGTALRLRLVMLRGAADQHRQGVAGAAASLLQAVDQASEDADSARRRLQDLLERRDELRGRLRAYKAMAGQVGLAEDDALDRLYRRPHRLLYDERCDLSAAAVAVDRYADALRGKRQEIG